MKANSNFKMSKTVKRMLALMKPERRAAFKKAMIDAQLAEESARKTQSRDNNESKDE